MKRKIIVLLLVAFSVVSYAQTKNAIKLNLFGGVEYEHGFKGHSAGYINFQAKFGKTNGYLVDLGYKYYFKESIKGVYFTPLLSFGSFYINDMDASVAGMGFAFGSQWIWWKHLAFDINIGYGQYSAWETYNPDNKFNLGTLIGKIAIGYAF